MTEARRLIRNDRLDFCAQRTDPPQRTENGKESRFGNGIRVAQKSGRKKKAGLRAADRLTMSENMESLFDYFHIDRLDALAALAEFVFHLLLLVECPEAFFDDARVMNENFLTVLASNESVAFLAIEPFNFAFHKNKIIDLYRKVKEKLLKIKTYWLFFDRIRRRGHIFVYICVLFVRKNERFH